MKDKIKSKSPKGIRITLYKIILLLFIFLYYTNDFGSAIEKVMWLCIAVVLLLELITIIEWLKEPKGPSKNDTDETVDFYKEKDVYGQDK